MYIAPMTSIGSLIWGMISDNILQKNVQIIITTEKPAQIPKLKGKDLRNPNRPAFDMDMRLLGPGVIAVTTA